MSLKNALCFLHGSPSWLQRDSDPSFNNIHRLNPEMFVKVGIGIKTSRVEKNMTAALAVGWSETDEIFEKLKKSKYNFEKTSQH